MKKLHKYTYIFLSSLMLILLLICVSEKRTEMQFYFLVKNSENTSGNAISIYDAEDGNYYVFIPCYAEMDQVFMKIESNHRFSLNDVQLSDGMNCGDLELEKPYVFNIDDSSVATLWFYRSSNVSTLYVDTVSGSMDKIHEDKEYEEYASMVLYTSDGNLDYYDKAITIEGRGNTSWRLPKKPYTITLGKSHPLLGMESSKKWVLNANGFDRTNLHNKIVYSFADSIGPYSAWSPDCTYVEVYLNGEYAGLYLLCQKVNSGEEHLPLEKEDYFCELAIAERIWHSPLKFWICSSRFGEIIMPEAFDNDQKAFLEAYIGDFQTALFSDSGINHDRGLAWTDYLDTDSWARKYMIEEVFSNFDSGQASEFFWLDVSEQKLYAGPCWDYDLTFGLFAGTTWSTPDCLLAQRNWEEDLSWYYALCQKEEFIELVSEIYVKEFRPLLQEYITEVIGNTASDIESAVFADTLRWPLLYSETNWHAAVANMADYLRLRMEFLDSLWIERNDFCIVTLQTEEETYNICVPAGSACTTIPETELLGASGPWCIRETNEPFDSTQLINTDIVLVPRTGDTRE